VNDVADIEQTNSGDPVERRQQFRIAQLSLGVFDRRLIGFDYRLFLSVLRLLGGDLLLRRKALFLQRDIPAEVDPSIFEMGFVAGEIGVRLIELRLISARIELSQELAFFDILAVLEVDADDLLGDQASHRRRVQRRHIADPGQHDREILLFDRRCDNRNRRRGPRCRGRDMREVLPSQVPREGDCQQYEADKQRGTAPVLNGGFVRRNQWCGHRILFPHRLLSSRARAAPNASSAQADAAIAAVPPSHRDPRLIVHVGRLRPIVV